MRTYKQSLNREESLICQASSPTLQATTGFLLFAFVVFASTSDFYPTFVPLLCFTFASVPTNNHWCMRLSLSIAIYSPLVVAFRCLLLILMPKGSYFLSFCLHALLFCGFLLALAAQFLCVCFCALCFVRLPQSYFQQIIIIYYYSCCWCFFLLAYIYQLLLMMGKRTLTLFMCGCVRVCKVDFGLLTKFAEFYYNFLAFVF